jgi:uncharacterized protein YneF (UPF0154 family)
MIQTFMILLGLLLGMIIGSWLALRKAQEK